MTEKLCGQNKHFPVFLTIPLVLFLFSGCTILRPGIESPEGQVMKRVASGDFPVFSDDMMNDGLEHAIGRSLDYLSKIPADRVLNYGGDRIKAGRVIRSLEMFRNYIRKNPSHHAISRFIKKHYPGIAVIMLTGHGSEIAATEGIKAGAFDYLTKPCDIEELINKISAAVEAKDSANG